MQLLKKLLSENNLVQSQPINNLSNTKGHGLIVVISVPELRAVFVSAHRQFAQFDKTKTFCHKMEDYFLENTSIVGGLVFVDI